MLEEHRLAQEALERKMTQDREDPQIAYQLASQEAQKFFRSPESDSICDNSRKELSNFTEDKYPNFRFQKK